MFDLTSVAVTVVVSDPVVTGPDHVTRTAHARSLFQHAQANYKCVAQRRAEWTSSWSNVRGVSWTRKRVREWVYCCGGGSLEGAMLASQDLVRTEPVVEGASSNLRLEYEGPSKVVHEARSEYLTQVLKAGSFSGS